MINISSQSLIILVGDKGQLLQNIWELGWLFGLQLPGFCFVFRIIEIHLGRSHKNVWFPSFYLGKMGQSAKNYSVFPSGARFASTILLYLCFGRFGLPQIYLSSYFCLKIRITGTKTGFGFDSVYNIQKW